MRGVSPIIAIVLLVMIIISVSSSVFLFLSSTQERIQARVGNETEKLAGQISILFDIENINKDGIYIRNKGSGVIDKLRFYLDAEPLYIKVDDTWTLSPNTTIHENEVKEFFHRRMVDSDAECAVPENCKPQIILPGTHFIKAVTGASEQKIQFNADWWEKLSFEPNTQTGNKFNIELDGFWFDIVLYQPI